MEGKIFNCTRRGKRTSTSLAYILRMAEYWKHHLDNPSGVYHPVHKTADEKRILKNKRARLKRAKAKKK